MQDRVAQLKPSGRCLYLRDFFIRIFNTPQSSSSQPNADSKDDKTQDQTAEVADEVTDQFPLAAKEIAETAIKDDPGEFSERVVDHKSAEPDPASACDQIGGKRQGGDQKACEIDCETRARFERSLCASPGGRSSKAVVHPVFGVEPDPETERITNDRANQAEKRSKGPAQNSLL